MKVLGHLLYRIQNNETAANVIYHECISQEIQLVAFCLYCSLQQRAQLERSHCSKDLSRPLGEGFALARNTGQEPGSRS